MIVEQTKNFKKIIKKLHSSFKKNIDEAITKIINDPKIGNLKVGDLSSIRVYKFNVNKQEQLLAYSYFESENKVILIAVGSHENFYRDLKKITKL